MLAISEARSEGSRKLCGSEYIRTVIYICASSRWRRHPGALLQGQQGNMDAHDFFIYYYFFEDLS